MKTKNIIFTGLLAFSGLFVSCIDEDMNVDPMAINKDQLKPEWSLNASISNAQMDPHIAERIFVLSWKSASRFDRANGLSLGSDNNSWALDYLSIGWGAGWLRDANLAIDRAQAKIDNKEAEAGAYPYYKNVLQMSRIWRAYLLSEFADTFGPMPTVDSFTGENPSFEDQKAVYTFILTELKEATNALDTSIKMADLDPNLDLFYASDVSKWAKYGNSLRMRIAMRLSEIEPQLAKQHFEEAASKPFISVLTDIAQVQENDGWSSFTGVMTRTWNAQPMSKTFYNLTVGLGGLEFPVPAALASHIKDPNTYMGLKLDKHFPTTTNDPSAGYLFNGIPKYVDPRAPLLYHIVGYRDDKGVYPETILKNDGDAAINPQNFNAIKFLKEGTEETAEATVDITNIWSTAVAGVWDQKGSLSADYIKNRNFPSLSNKYRTSTNKRVFFGNWESYFLLAEAKYRGWNVPGTAQENYEKGIAASFEYHGISSQLTSYLSSTAYNRVGTSVLFTHTAEAADYSINYEDGYTGTTGKVTYKYPENTIYNSGATNNDVLTKIITQKYLAQVPWLPLEAWSDHRRLGLPFFENPAAEVAYDSQSQIPLTPQNSKTSSWDFYPKRMRFPVDWKNRDPKGYEQAQSFLNGPDKTSTPLWWSK